MRNRPLVQLAATAVAATFLLVAVLGFVPGITTNYGNLSFAGHESEAKLVGLFQVSVLHNIVHGLFGVIGLALAKSVAGARNFLIGGGIVYLVLTAYGSVIDLDSNINFVPVNVADNFLHLVLGVAMIGLGVVFGKQAAHSTDTGATSNAPADPGASLFDPTRHRKEVRHVQGVRMRDQ